MSRRKLNVLAQSLICTKGQVFCYLVFFVCPLESRSMQWIVHPIDDSEDDSDDAEMITTLTHFGFLDTLVLGLLLLEHMANLDPQIIPHCFDGGKLSPTVSLITTSKQNSQLKLP